VGGGKGLAFLIKFFEYPVRFKLHPLGWVFKLELAVMKT
jgi:hypothetical protein